MESCVSSYGNDKKTLGLDLFISHNISPCRCKYFLLDQVSVSLYNCFVCRKTS